MNHRDSDASPVLLTTASENVFFGDQSYNDFELSLRLHLLFYPDGIALPDSFFFASCVLEHFSRSRRFEKTVLDAAIERGLLTILARGRDGHQPLTFLELLAHIRALNVNGPAEEVKMEELASNLDSRHRNLKTRAWPEDMGGLLGSMARHRICVDLPTIEDRAGAIIRSHEAQDALVGFHRDSERWREFLQNATPNGDLRISRFLGTAWESQLNDKPPGNITIHMLQNELKKRGVGDARTNGRFFSLLANLYDINFAEQFQLHLERVNYDHLKRLYCDMAPDAAGEPRASGSEVLRFPTVNRVLEWPATFIFECRDSQAYTNYAAALVAWRADPSDTSMQGLLLERMKEYCTAISNRDRLRNSDDVDAVVEIGRTAFTRFPDFVDEYVLAPFRKRGAVFTIMTVAMKAAEAVPVLLEGVSAGKLIGTVAKQVPWLGQFGFNMRLTDLPANLYASGHLAVGPHGHMRGPPTAIR